MLVLASTSATRQAMLRHAGLDFAATAPEVDEGALVAANPRWMPRQTALQLAEAKAIDVSRRNPGAHVIGADQVLALGNKVFGKPRNRAHCRTQLQELRGQTHVLISAVVLATDGTTTWTYTDEAQLVMRKFSYEILDAYIEAMGDD